MSIRIKDIKENPSLYKKEIESIKSFFIKYPFINLSYDDKFMNGYFEGIKKKLYDFEDIDIRLDNDSGLFKCYTDKRPEINIPDDINFNCDCIRKYVTNKIRSIDRDIKLSKVKLH